MLKPLIILLITLFSSLYLHAQDRPVFRIATEHYPPYEMKDSPTGLKGFDYDVMVEIFSRLNYEIEVEFLPWNRVLAYAKHGKVLGILTCAYKEDRNDFIVFSDPISKRTDGFYMRNGFNGLIPNTLEDLKGQRVASVSGYTSLKKLAELNMNPIEVLNTELAIGMLKRNRYDYLLLNKQSTDFIIKQLGLSNDFKFYPIVDEAFYFCFSRKYKGVNRILDEFNKTLKEIRLDGTYKRIHDKYRYFDIN